MTARYGDFVLYRPPLKATTLLLWFGPALMLVGGAAVLIVVLRRRSRMAAEAFDADDELAERARRGRRRPRARRTPVAPADTPDVAGSERKAEPPRPLDARRRRRRARRSARLLASLSVFVAALAGIGYWQTGSPSLIRQPAPAADVAGAGPQADAGASAPSAVQQIEAMVGKLAERMKDKPDDAEGWTMLARSYTVLGRFADALPAYARAAELQPPTVAPVRLRRRGRGDPADREQPALDRPARARAEGGSEASQGAGARRQRRLRPRRLRRSRSPNGRSSPTSCRRAASSRRASRRDRRGARQARSPRAPRTRRARVGADDDGRRASAVEQRGAGRGHERQRHRDARSGSRRAGLARRLGLRLRPCRRRQPHAARGAARPGQGPAARLHGSTTAWRWRRG